MTDLLKFKQSLGSRIDALEIAIADLGGGDESVRETILRLAKLLEDRAMSHSLELVADCARRIQAATPDSMTARVRELIDLLREEAAGATPVQPTVVLAGKDRTFNDRMALGIGKPSRRVFKAETSREAWNVIRERDVMCIVVNGVLSDTEGRLWVTELKSDARAAGIPILFIGDAELEQSDLGDLLSPADSYMVRPVDMVQLVRWIDARLRRSPDRTKEARRDTGTGLLNRAALQESFDSAQEDCARSGEPLALALLRVDQAGATLPNLEPRKREELIQALGLLLSGRLRSTDILARWGSAEFAVLFPGEDQFGATRAMEKIIDTYNADDSLRPAESKQRPHLAAGVTVISPGGSLDKAVSEAAEFAFKATTSGESHVVSSEASPPGLRTYRILLLIGDDGTVNVMQQLLHKSGFEVTHYADHSKAKEADLDNQTYHLLVLDEEFPPDGGFELLQQIRQQPKNSRLPILMLVAGRAEASISRAVELGANDYLCRPFAPGSFISRAHRLLSRGSASWLDPCRIPTILILDGDFKALILAGTALHQSGAFSVMLSKSADDALERIDADNPEILLVDNSRVDAQGARLLERMKGKQMPPSLKIVAALPPAEAEASRPLPLQACGWVPKPYDPLSLARRIQELVGLSTETRPMPAVDASRLLNSELQRVMEPPE